MGLWSFFKRLTCILLKLILPLILAIAILPLIPNLPPDFNFTVIRSPEPPILEGKLATNHYLDRAERLFEGDIKGPECFAVLNGELYTTLHGGFVAKVVGNEIHPVVKFGQPCESWLEEEKCGRPLGIFAGPDELLYVADAYYGIFQYDVHSAKSTQLVSPQEVIEGRRPRIFNSIAVAADGTIFWTDSSTDVSLKDGLFAMLADGTGRLIQYDPATKKNTVLIDRLQFANGVALAPDDSFVIVAETGMSRLHRYWLAGPKKGTSELFGPTLPGLPDNLRGGSKGFLASLVVASDQDHPVLTQVISKHPYIRKALSRALALFELMFKKIGDFYPNIVSDRVVHFLGHFESSQGLAPARVTLVVLDTDGRIIESFHQLDESVRGISDAIQYRGQIFLGSPFNDYLGKVQNPTSVARFQDVFPTVPKFSIRVKKVTEGSASTKPVTSTTPKPTTSTPKPSTSTPKPSTTTSKPSASTPKPSTSTPKPSTSTPKPSTSTSKPSASTPKPSTSTPKPSTTVKPTTTSRPKTAPEPKTTPQPQTTTTKQTTTSAKSKSTPQKTEVPKEKLKPRDNDEL